MNTTNHIKDFEISYHDLVNLINSYKDSSTNTTAIEIILRNRLIASLVNMYYKEPVVKDIKKTFNDVLSGKSSFEVNEQIDVCNDTLKINYNPLETVFIINYKGDTLVVPVDLHLVRNIGQDSALLLHTFIEQCLEHSAINKTSVEESIRVLIAKKSFSILGVYI